MHWDRKVYDYSQGKCVLSHECTDTLGCVCDPLYLPTIYTCCHVTDEQKRVLLYFSFSDVQPLGRGQKHCSGNDSQPIMRVITAVTSCNGFGVVQADFHTVLWLKFLGTGAK